ncbi:MAG: hypothetical protein ACK5RL_09380 [Acidimicrobiales bacterium]
MPSRTVQPSFTTGAVFDVHHALAANGITHPDGMSNGDWLVEIMTAMVPLAEIAAGVEVTR